jgi:two-component system, OmpR family, sensor kinase
MTVKTRITLLIVGAGFIASLLFSVVVFLELIEQPIEIMDAMLEEEAHSITSVVLERHKTLENAKAQAISANWVEIYGQSDHRLLYRSALAGSIRLSPVAPGSAAIVRVPVGPDKTRPGQGDQRIVMFRVKTFRVTQEGRSFIVQIARPMEKLEDEILELVLGIISGLILSTLALVAISRYVAGKILKPVGDMQNLAREISGKNLERRIPAGPGQDEFNQLARTINGMLDRLQHSFIRQRTFLFDTSHELKTPLTTMRLVIDNICSDDAQKLPQAPRENILQLKTQVLRMERLVKDLLNLSALETLARIDPQPVRLADMLSALSADYQIMADARQIQMSLDLDPSLVVQGDREKLNRAFSNILDNAIKYNCSGGRVAVTGSQSATEVTLCVANTGPGIAEDEIPKVFDQFYRVEKSRSSRHGGTGLGLAIVKRIVELHSGSVDLQSRDDWTRMTVRLPKII